jgi:hypothetical protein
MAPRVAYSQPQAGGFGAARTKKVFGGTFTNVAADVALNAQTAICRVPAGFILTGLLGTIGDLDSGAALTLSLGDAASNNRLFSASTVGQAGGAVPALAATGLLYQFPTDTDILLTATAAAAGLGPTPTSTIYLEGFMANP